VSVQWAVVVPVKRGAAAKSRLAAHLGRWRVSVARAFVLDTLTAAVNCPRVGRLVVVSDDDIDASLKDAGVRLIDDPSGGSDMNLAVRTGLHFVNRSSTGSSPVAILPADLPALRPQDLDAALSRAETLPVAAASDADGCGTTMLTAIRPGLLEPQFGKGSFALHRAAGAAQLAVGPRLAR